MTDPEWFASYPLDDRTKWELFRDCSRCHTMRRPSMSTYWTVLKRLQWVMQRMVYSAGSSPMRFQLPANATPHWGRAEGGEPSALQRRQAEAVASINLHNGMWNYELKTMPRPKGKETDVIYTTWDLPATARPHDTRIAADGTIFFNHFNDNAIGRLDPKTGEVKEWHWPYRAKEGSFQPTGARTLMGPDESGRWYIGNQAQSGVVVFDPKTEQFEFHDPPGGGGDDPCRAHTSTAMHGARSRGPVAGGGVYQIHSATWQHVEIKGTTEKPLYAYDIAADSRNNVYGSARGAPYVWRIDAKTNGVLDFDIPAEPRGVGSFGWGMRRGITDSQDRLWWGRLRRRLHRHARSAQARSGKADEALRRAVSVFLPVRRAVRRARLHMDGRYLRGSRRAHERRERRMEFLSVAVRSEHPRHQSATSLRATVCRGFGSVIRIKR